MKEKYGQKYEKYVDMKTSEYKQIYSYKFNNGFTAIVDVINYGGDTPEVNIHAFEDYSMITFKGYEEENIPQILEMIKSWEPIERREEYE